MTDESKETEDLEDDDDSIEEIEIDLDDVKFIKTSNGEELIATVVEESEHKLGVFIPCKVMYSIQDDESGDGFYTETMLIPWFQNSDPQFIVPVFKFHIVSMANPTESYKRFYVRIAKKIFEEALSEMDDENEQPEDEAFETKMQLLTEDVEAQKEELSENEQAYYMNTYREINKFIH
jgi:hypothetical protein